LWLNPSYNYKLQRNRKMIAPVPKLEINQLINEISAMVSSGNSSDLALRRVEKQTIALFESKAANPAHCHMVLGLVAMMQKDRAKCEKAVKNAIILAPRDSAVLMNGITCLTSMGNTRDAVALIKRMCDQFPDDKEILSYAIIQSHHVLQLSYACTLLCKFDKLAINDPVDLIRVRKPLLRAHETAEAYGMPESELLNRLETAIESVRARGLEVERSSSLTLHDGTFHYQLHIDADSTACAETNFHIADALVEKYEDTGIEFFSVVCRPLADFNEPPAVHGVE
jgi:hypothetical protein